MTPQRAQKQLASHVRARRLNLGLTQVEVSERASVALATLRKFERTGAASVETLFKLLLVVGGLEDVVTASQPKALEFTSIEDVLKADRTRKRGRRS